MIKKILLPLLSLFFILPFPSPAQGNDQPGYVITDFKSHLKVENNAKLSVTEEIDVYFEYSRHGIYREIPVVYSVHGKTTRARLTVLSVTDEENNDYLYEVTRREGNVQIKIGNSDEKIKGLKHYKIKYVLDGVIKRFVSHDEVYWNVTGGDWDTVIRTASCILESPYAKIIKTKCYTGLAGETGEECTTVYSDKMAEFRSDIMLGQGRDFTIAVALEKDNDIVFPGFMENFMKTILDNWGYLASIAPFLIIAGFWKRMGRDTTYTSDNIYYKPSNVSQKTVSLFSRKHIPFVYHPIDGLSPSEVGTIIDEKVDIHDVTAEMCELARLKFIKIIKLSEKKESEYALVKGEYFGNKDKTESLKDYQVYLLEELFKADVVEKSKTLYEKLAKGKDFNEKYLKLKKGEFVLLAALEIKFYKSLSEFKKKLYKRMEKEEFFYRDPDVTRKMWMLKYFLLEALFFVAVFFFVFSTYNFIPLVVLIILFVPGIILAASMPRRTAKGYSLYRQIEGLKWYLEKGKWRYEINEKNLFVEEMLPLAIALGVVNKLVLDMKKYKVKPPSYFEGSSWSAFSYDIGLFEKTLQGAILSTSGGKWSGSSSWSGGSGFSGGYSGGGFGGGGGRSW